MTSEQHDINKITNAIVLLNAVDKLEFITETGQEFGNTLKQALNDLIKPYGRECVVKLREELKNKENGN